MTSAFMIRTLTVSAANALFAGTILFVYRGVYARTKAPFSLALTLFAAAFLAHDVLVTYSLGSMMAIVPSAMDLYLFGIGTLEALGLFAMLWTATR